MQQTFSKKCPLCGCTPAAEPPETAKPKAHQKPAPLRPQYIKNTDTKGTRQKW